MSTTIDVPNSDSLAIRVRLKTLPIERREKLSKNEVLTEYLAEAGKPVIVTDAMDAWPARTKWDFDFFGTHFGDDLVEASDCIKRPTVERRMRLCDYLEYVASPQSHPLAELNTLWPLYIYGYKPFRDHPELKDDYASPYFVDDWLEHLSEPLRQAYNQGWILLSAAGARARMHVDFGGTHAWLAQIYGRKECALFSPQDTPYVYDGAVDPFAPDFEKYPLFENVTMWRGSLQPGQILLIPSGWWHHVLTVTDSITVSHNIVNSANFALFVDNVCRGLPGTVMSLSANDSPIRAALDVKWTCRGFDGVESNVRPARD